MKEKRKNFTSIVSTKLGQDPNPETKDPHWFGFLCPDPDPEVKPWFWIRVRFETQRGSEIDHNALQINIFFI